MAAATATVLETPGCVVTCGYDDVTHVISAVNVTLASGSLTLTLYAGGVARWSKSTRASGSFSLPAGLGLMYGSASGHVSLGYSWTSA